MSAPQITYWVVFGGAGMIHEALGVLLFCIVAVGGPAVIWHAIVMERDQRSLRKGRE